MIGAMLGGWRTSMTIHSRLWVSTEETRQQLKDLLPELKATVAKPSSIKVNASAAVGPQRWPHTQAAVSDQVERQLERWPIADPLLLLLMSDDVVRPSRAAHRQRSALNQDLATIDLLSHQDRRGSSRRNAIFQTAAQSSDSSVTPTAVQLENCQISGVLIDHAITEVVVEGSADDPPVGEHAQVDRVGSLLEAPNLLQDLIVQTIARGGSFRPVEVGYRAPEIPRDHG